MRGALQIIASTLACAAVLPGMVLAQDIGLPSYSEMIKRAEQFDLPDVETLTSPKDLERYKDISRDILKSSAASALEEMNRQAPKLGVTIETQAPDTRPRQLPDRYRATILVSWSMGEERLKELFLRYRTRGDVRFVFRGIPAEMTVPDFAVAINKLTTTETGAGVDLLIDPEIFSATGVRAVPTVVIEDLQGPDRSFFAQATDMGDIVAVGRGFSNPDYVFDRFELGLTEVAQHTLHEVVEEDLITRAQREAAAVLSNMTRDPEVLRDRFWSRQHFAAKAFNVTPAPQNRERQLFFAWVAKDDILDANGQLLAHAGEVFMPNDVMAFDRQIFVFDPSSHFDMMYVREKSAEPLPKGVTKRVYIVSKLPKPEAGEKPWQVLQDLVDEFRHPVFVLNQNFLSSFQIEHTPTMLVPRDIQGRVEVFAIETAHF